MSYRFLENVAIADVAFEVQAQTLRDLFLEAAEALMKVQVQNLDNIKRKERVPVDLTSSDPEKLLHQFLQEIVYWKDAKQLLLLPDSLKVRQEQDRVRLKAILSGECLDPKRHEQGVDVKAVTWHAFAVTATPQGWHATVVLDI